MNIKVGDRVRIKTEEELLAEGWWRECLYLKNGKDHAVFIKDCGRSMNVRGTGDGIIKLDDGICYSPSAIIRTLDEYICSLPLEERAGWFVQSFNAGDHIEYRAIKGRAYYTYDEALQATIEALKQPKE